MTAPNVVINSGALLIQGGGVSPDMPQVFPLYTLNGTDPERIDSVYTVIEWVANSSRKNVLAVVLVAPNGEVIDEQATPPLLGVDGAVLETRLSWSRQGNDTAQLPTAEELFSQDDVRRAWCNMPLPDITLPPLSSVRLLVWVEDGGEGSPTVVPNVALTTTRNAGAVSSTTEVVLNTQPILVAGPG